MFSTSKEARSAINSLLTQQQQLVLGGLDKPGAREQFDKRQKDIEDAEQIATRLEGYEQRVAANNQFTRSPRPGVGDGTAVYELSADERRSRINAAFRSYARTGQIPAEHRDLLTTSDVTGGALIPQEFSGVLVESAKFYGPTASKVKQKVTKSNGAPMKFSFGDDTANSLTLLGTEGTSSPQETDPTFSSKVVGVDTVTGGLVKVSFQELEDSSFDLNEFLRSAFGIRYARGLEKAVTLGTDGAGTALPNHPTGGLLASAGVGTTTGSLANGIEWDDLVNLYAALDPAYQVDASWVMSSTTRSYLLGLKDGFGRPYYTPDPTSDSPFGKLLGMDVVLNQAMPGPTAGAFTASSTPVMLGSLERSYLLRTDGEPSLLRLNERYADTLEVGFFLYSRIGAVSLNAGVDPIVKMKMAAS